MANPTHVACFLNHRKVNKMEVKVKNYLELHEIDIEIDSMQNDGSQSWIVIRRCVDKYVTELPEENEKLIHFEEVASSTVKPVATKQKEHFTPALSSSSTTDVPMSHRKWNDIPAEESFNIPKRMSRILTTLRPSSRKRRSNGVEKIVTNVLS